MNAQQETTAPAWRWIVGRVAVTLLLTLLSLRWLYASELGLRVGQAIFPLAVGMFVEGAGPADGESGHDQEALVFAALAFVCSALVVSLVATGLRVFGRRSKSRSSSS